MPQRDVANDIRVPFNQNSKVCCCLLFIALRFFQRFCDSKHLQRRFGFQTFFAIQKTLRRVEGDFVLFLICFCVFIANANQNNHTIISRLVLWDRDWDSKDSKLKPIIQYYFSSSGIPVLPESRFERNGKVRN